MKVNSYTEKISVCDKQTDFFEGQYRIPQGITYNSYLISDEKLAVLDTVDASFTDEWLKGLSEALGGNSPDYLIIQHMEPDHSAGLGAFMEKYPEATIVASEMAFMMMKNFFKADFSDRRLVVKDGDELCLGSVTLRFISAPMVHWPEVIMTYDDKSKTLFSADAFGRFGCGDDIPWNDEARRYYIGIVGKYGAQVKALLKKASELEIKKICPLHGPVLSENIGRYVELYSCWADYRPEQKGVVIAYTSVYGNTKAAVGTLGKLLVEKGCEVRIYDLARCDMSEAVSDAFCKDRLVLASTTYNNSVFPFMREFLTHLSDRGFKRRAVGLIENGSWAPVAAKAMRELLSGCEEIRFIEPVVTILSSPDAKAENQIEALSEALFKLN